MTLRLVLMRHGQTHSNLQRVIDTRPPGADLTEKGQQQALSAGAELAEMCGPRISEAYCSVAVRTQQTAERVVGAYEGILGLQPGDVPIAVTEGIHEIDLGELEGKDDHAAYEAYMENLAAWLRSDASAQAEGGETYLQLLDRYVPVLDALIADHEGQDTDLLVVSHGGAIRTVAAHAASVDPQVALDAYIANCQFVVLEPGGKPFGQWAVRYWAGHDVH